ncbi:MAG: pyruvate formate-lyase-activating protein [Vallitaleaceae bacterium]|jgi:pyruvate formate lyase activating enzyme|nr:pyruvate formate-lyase-activating protein [Vallitaleaceae bacterium]
MKQLTGRVHSIETCGTVDGPGIRFVLFMQGCPLRCKYCHNPDTWKVGSGDEMTVDAVFEEIVKYKSYMKFSGGGFTATGGEPLLQAAFLIELFKMCREAGIHTAIDTSGFILNDHVKALLEYTDLVILDIKNFDKEQYTYITGVSLEPTLEFMSYLRKINMPTWIRYVLVPTLSDDLSSIEDLGRYVQPFTNIEKIEILPFHKMGEYKWEALDYRYELADISEPGRALMDQVLDILQKYHHNVCAS